MLFLIIKDSIILFFLVYALLELAEDLLNFLKKLLPRHSAHPRKFYTIDLENVKAEKLEGLLRQSTHVWLDPVFLIAENLTPEATALLHKFQRSHAALYLVTRKEMQKIISSQEALDAFLESGPTASPAQSK